MFINSMGKLKTLWHSLLICLVALLVLTIAVLLLVQPIMSISKNYIYLIFVIFILWILVPISIVLLYFHNHVKRHYEYEQFREVVLKLQLGEKSIRLDEEDDESRYYVATTFNHLVDYYQAALETLEKQNLSLAQANERYQVIIDYTNEIIFDWDFETDEAEYSLTWWRKFGMDPVQKDVSLELLKGEFVHRDDRSVFSKWVSRIYKGTEKSKEEFRFSTIDGDYHWVRIRTVPIKNEEGQAVRVVGLIQDIDESKKRVAALEHRADFDHLTQIFNRSAFEMRVQQLIDSKIDFALLYIDIDNFRVFNTRFGHEFGDRVIQFIGTKLSESLGQASFAGRVGGDEFIVCVTDKKEMENVTEVAQRILDKLKAGLNVRESNEPVQVHCSIGIIFYPKDGDTLIELSSKSDKAMYEVKNSGKNGYKIFES